MELSNDYFMPAEDFAARHDLTTEAVIRLIRYKVLGGRLFHDRWFIDLTSRRTQIYVSNISKGVPGTSGVSMAKALHIIGKIAICFGVIAGLVLLFAFSQPAVSLLGFESKAELTVIEIVITFSITLFYCALGVICLGIAKLIELLDK